MLLLGFLLVIAASLTIWAALTLNDHAGAPPLWTEDERPAPPPDPASRPSNDDAFERFLRSDPKRDESDF